MIFSRVHRLLSSRSAHTYSMLHKPPISSLVLDYQAFFP
uniref:Uncharacterized protein n=1 Tax=Anguilla anguilla TaxID=7936 RepID=A0A0E9VN64_ANGAN